MKGRALGRRAARVVRKRRPRRGCRRSVALVCR
jgi:hypothetical protein